MCTDEYMQNEKILNLQNALIRQCIDQVGLKNDAEDFAERADFYENLYNKQRSDFYNLELKYKNLELKYKNLESKYMKLYYSKDFINNLGSLELLVIIIKRLKTKIWRLIS